MSTSFNFCSSSCPTSQPTFTSWRIRQELIFEFWILALQFELISDVFMTMETIMKWPQMKKDRLLRKDPPKWFGESISAVLWATHSRTSLLKGFLLLPRNSPIICRLRPFRCSRKWATPMGVSGMKPLEIRNWRPLSGLLRQKGKGKRQWTKVS